VPDPEAGLRMTAMPPTLRPQPSVTASRTD
jgi:hypothetical protein